MIFDIVQLLHAFLVIGDSVYTESAYSLRFMGRALGATTADRAHHVDPNTARRELGCGDAGE
jgi:hypothetical protein